MMHVSTPVSHAYAREKVRSGNMRREEVGEGFQVPGRYIGIWARMQRHTTAPSQEISEV
jgi:hypothetical protein